MVLLRAKGASIGAPGTMVLVTRGISEAPTTTKGNEMAHSGAEPLDNVGVGWMELSPRVEG